MRMTSKRKISIILVMFLLISNLVISNQQQIVNAAPSDNEKRACWVSFLDIQHYLCDTDEKTFRRKVNNMCENMKKNLVNTVIFQVRPMGDAIYNSNIYPWSYYINSSGKNPGYDPLSIFVETSHSKGMKIEAWINPFRLSNGTSSTEKYKKTSFYKKNKSCIVEYDSGDGQKKLSLDPGNRNARQLIIDGVNEIVKNYNVDGIHFDDYFYVSGLCPNLDENAKKKNVNELVKGVYASLKKIDNKCEFGISPQGNIGNCNAQGADVATWLSEAGYIDYIMPQIYWSDNYQSSTGKMLTMYTDRIKEWKKLNSLNLPMYVGFALYKCGIDNGIDLGWSKKSSNLSEQYKILKNNGYNGYALFRYAWLDYALVNNNYNNGMLTGDSSKDNKIKKYVGEELNNLKNAINNYNENGDKPCYIYYSSHIQGIGWQDEKNDGVLSGTTNLGKRLEGIRISLGGKAGKGSVEYRTHCQRYGWMPWVSDGSMSGTEGEAKRMEAIQIRLKGEASNKFDVYYRVHVQSFGWLDWAKNGEAAGSSTFEKRLEAIEIKLVQKGGAAPGDTTKPYVNRKISYNCHVQTYGWQNKSYDGETNGTTRQSKRLEAIKISIADNLYDGNIEYRVHCQTYDWLPWVSNGELAGTTGQGKRLEAIEIKLSGEISEKYDVFYRVHCQKYGWLPWVSNGELAGTTGEGKRLEAIEIKLLEKGTTP